VFGYGSSIDLAKALDPDTLIADELNDEALPAAHGYPLRIIAPGYIGARSVKWVSRITVQAQPSENYFQTRAYKLFPPEVSRENVDWAQGEMLDALNINALIVSPQDGAALPSGTVRFSGYAISSPHAAVTKVSLSLDGGRTWQDAQLDDRATRWAWRLWSHEATLTAGTYQVVVRAEDSSGAVQPDDVSAVWNFLGYMNNVCHRIAVTVG
jgi:sulfite oxidase